MTLLIMDRTIRQKVNKDTKDINNTIHKLDITGSSEHYINQLKNIHSSEEHMEHSPGLGKFKMTEIAQTMFSDHNRMKLEINSKEILGFNKYVETMHS